MAYAAVLTTGIVRYTLNGRRHYYAKITETEARDTSEWSFPGFPRFGRIVQYRATKTAGTGTTIAPVVGKAATFAANTNDFIATMFAAAASGNAAEQKYEALDASGTLIGRSTVNSVATDHTIVTEITIIEGLH